MLLRVAPLASIAVALLACACAAAAPPTAARPNPTASAAVASPSPSPTASPIPSQSPSPVQAASPAPAPPPAALVVAFSGLPSGAYPVHLHSVCSGAQAFHITVLQTLVVRGGAGRIEVPSGYFGRGLCVIVYGSPSLSAVLATRRI